MPPELAVSNERQKPRALAGMEGIRSCWDTTHNYYSARIMPGEFFVTVNEEIVTTVLGSCVSACIRDPELGIGGMNHFMLPDVGPGQLAKGVNAAQYGVNAMEVLINTILANGGQRSRLEVKLFGGAAVLRSHTNVGEKNIEFVHEYLSEEGMPIATEDLGGLHPRKIIYFPFSGRTLMKKLPIDNPDAVFEEESKRAKTTRVIPGGIDLF